MFKREQCGKELVSKRNLYKHTNFNCKGIIKQNECKFCNKILSNSSSKSRYQKTCKKNPIKEVNKSINKTINNYNGENLDYLDYKTKHKLMMKWLEGGLSGIITKRLLEIHFNNEHPENQNIKMGYNGHIEYLKDGEYIQEPGRIFFNKHVEKLESPALDAIDFIKPAFKILERIHKDITPFLGWVDFGYEDTRDIDINYTSHNLEEIRNQIAKEFMRTVKNYSKLFKVVVSRV